MPSPRNKFVDLASLHNEAAVENLFVTPLLRDLGYQPNQILFKDAIAPVSIALGSRTVRYRPDYQLIINGNPRVVVDAKHPEESLQKWVGQCASYCLYLNRSITGSNPVRYFLLSNAKNTIAYEWD